MPGADGMFAMIDLRELKISCSPHNFIEEEAVPSDALVVEQTWAKVNKDGSPYLALFSASRISRSII